MSGAHTHALYVHGHTPFHRLAPHAKLVAQFLFVFIVVATPRQAFWAFGAYAVLLAALIRVAGVPFPFVAKRLVFELPFVAFAFLLPFLGGGERMDVWGLSLSREGLWGAWNILAKATLGLGASILIAATTTMPEFLRGFERLRLPRVFTSTASFMVRYFDVIADEMRRMKVAREARGYDPKWAWQARAFAASAGTMFIRAYERGERVYLAMQSRGYAGTLPTIDDPPTSLAVWARALAVPAVALVIAILAWMATP
jgi:cobalt/nickel transport system permease protein